MNISQVFKKSSLVLSLLLAMSVVIPAYALDLDSTVTDTSRTHYSNGTSSSSTVFKPVKKDGNSTSVKTIEHITTDTAPATIEKTKLPAVPALPRNANSSTVAPYNGVYSGKVPNSSALTPCNFVIGDLIIDDSVVKSKYKNTSVIASNKTTTPKQVKTTGRKKVIIPKGTELRVISRNQINDYMPEGHTVEFASTQELSTSYYKIPKYTRFTAKVVDSHKPQLSCNGGLVKLKIVSANINGRNCPLNAGITKIKTDNVYFNNLKGDHTYWKTVGQKAKWGQKMFTKWSKTSTTLANKGAGVILAPFPYLGGCILSVASTVSSPVTAILGHGDRAIIPANTVFTIKFYDNVCY